MKNDARQKTRQTVSTPRMFRFAAVAPPCGEFPEEPLAKTA
jgi:hypothetical protein